MKYLQKIVAVLLLAVVGTLGSCKKDMISLNTNPASLPDVKPEYLFSGATADLDFNTRTQMINRYQFMQYMQYIVPDGDNANLTSAYWAPGASSGPAPSVTYYDDYFNGIGLNMRRIIQKIDAMDAATRASYADLRAICQVLDVYHAWRVVDIYGAMPYAQAFNDVKYPLPQYQGDYDLYKAFDDTLKAAATVLAGSQSGQVALGNQDFFYGGDIPSWEAFANTLRIKIAQRYEKRDPSQLASVLSDIATNFGGTIISSNAQSFGVNNTQGWNNNVDDINNLLLNYDASYAFVEYLKSTKDPRLGLLVRQNDFGTNDAIYNNIQANGTPAAIKTLDSAAINTSRYWGKHAFPASENDPAYGWTGMGRFQLFSLTTTSTPASLGFLSAIQTRYLLKNGGFGGFDARSAQSLMHTDEPFVNGSTLKYRSLFLTYAETCFMMAEIAQKGGNGLGKTAAEWYNMGVQASFDQYKTAAIATGVPGADTASLGDYLTRYPYTGSLAQIYSQEWVTLMVEPEEAWDMWKRTGYPQLTDDIAGNPTKIGDGSGIAYMESLYTGASDLLIPRRTNFTINNAGSVLNETNFNAALQNMMSKNPDFGPSGTYGLGRIWWDAQ